MEIRYLGTAAAEAIPAIFCDCEVCRTARKHGGRNNRTRSQALIDGRLLLDFCPDTVSHLLTYGIDMQDIGNCLITHPHQDHLYPTDLFYLHPGFSHSKEGYTFTVYGCAETGQKISPYTGNAKITNLFFKEVKPFETFTVDGYTVTSLKAYHGTECPMIYMISDGEKTLLYGHDTDIFPDETWEFLKKTHPRFDLVSLDCTEGAKEDIPYHGHMCLGRNKLCRDRVIAEGYADGNTKFVLNHFSHNGVKAAYEDFVSIAAREGFITSYDGMAVEV